jgi:NAD(P)H dehydrogenase (quinone)
VLEHLLAAGARSIVATTRFPDRLADFARRGVVVRWADFDKPESLPHAFAGAQRMLLISTNVTDGTDRRRRQHGHAIAAAEEIGVDHVVYTSLSRADTSHLKTAVDHVVTEKRIASTKLVYTVLRANLFAEVLLMVLPGAIATGMLFGLPDDGGAAYITRDDCAFAAATALLSSTGRTTLELTGLDVIRRTVLGRLATEVTGRDVFYVARPPQDLFCRYESAGLPAAFLLPLEHAIADGQFAFTTTDFFRLTGRQPAELPSFLARHRHALVRAA